MKPVKPERKRQWRIALFLAGALAAALIAPGIRRTMIVRQRLPSAPGLSAAVPALIDKIRSTETEARSFGDHRTELQRLAGLYHANGFFNEALTCYRLLADIDSHEPRWPHLIANIEASFGQLDDAIPFERRAASLAPDNFIVHLRLGDLLFKHNEVVDTEKAYRQALQLAPNDPYVLLGLARCSLRREDWSATRTYLQHAVEARPDFAAAWALLTDVETHLGNATAANYSRSRGNKQFRELIDPWLDFLSDLCYDPYQLSVNAAALTADPARARQLVERAITLAPQSSAYHRQLAKLLIAAHENQTAREHLEKAVALNPEDAESWSAYITFLLDLRDGRTAVIALRDALTHCPQSGYLHFIKGQALAATDHADLAETEFKLSKRLQPSEVRAYFELTSLYVKAGHLPEAVEEMQGAFAADPGNTTVMGMLAQLAIMEHDETETMQWVRKVRASPGDQSAVLQQIQSMYFRQFFRPLPE